MDGNGKEAKIYPQNDGGEVLTDHGRNVYRITIHNSDTDDKRFVYVVGDIAMSDVLPLFESDPHNLGKIEIGRAHV